MSLAILLAASGAVCLPPQGAGDNISSLYQVYSLRSVEIVSLAQKSRTDDLQRLISSEAQFDIGSGDVGRPLEDGVAGAVQLAKDLAAKTYEFASWSGPPYKRNACDEIAVEVTFVPENGRSSATVKFTYRNGHLISAKGWWKGRNVGEMSEFSNG